MSNKHEDLTLLSVRSAFDHLQSTINRALQRIERHQQLNNAELFSEIKERRKLAKVLLLDQRLIQLYKALVDNASLSIAEGEGLIHAELSSSVVTHEGNETCVNFKLNDTEYTLQLADQGGGAISYYGETFSSAHLSLITPDGQKVLTLHLDLGGEGNQEVVNESQITAFIPGSWIYDIIHAYETLVTSKRLKEINSTYSSEKLEQLKQKFGLSLQQIDTNQAE